MSGDRYPIADQNGVYFLTLTVVDWIDVFTRKQHRYIVVDSLKYCLQNKGLVIYAWCLMSNHLHLIVRAEEDHQLSSILRDFKQFTAKRILKSIIEGPESRRDWMLNRFAFAGKRLKRIKHYKFWKDDNHAIELSNNYMIDQKIDYIHMNPVEAHLVDESECYIFSSARNYAGMQGLIEVELLE